MLIAADVPAAPPVCADHRPVNLYAYKTVVALSPDCRWKLISLGSDAFAEGETGKDGLGKDWPPDKNVAVIDTRNGKVLTHFMMERSASLHWLADGRTLVVNHFAGSGLTEPLVIILAPDSPSATPKNLADLVFPDVLKRLNRRQDQVYHYYANYIRDLDDRILVSVQADYILSGTSGPANGRCFIYSVDKGRLSSYRFEREVPWQNDDLTCPVHPDERWD